MKPAAINFDPMKDPKETKKVDPKDHDWEGPGNKIKWKPLPPQRQGPFFITLTDALDNEEHETNINNIVYYRKDMGTLPCVRVLFVTGEWRSFTGTVGIIKAQIEASKL